MPQDLQHLVDEVHAFRACADHMPLGPRPGLQISTKTRILIASQAPGTRAHNSGIPVSDASGEKLRTWMRVGNAEGGLVSGLVYIGATTAAGAVVASGGGLAVVLLAAALAGGGVGLVGKLLARGLGRHHAACLQGQIERGGLLLLVRIMKEDRRQGAGNSPAERR